LESKYDSTHGEHKELYHLARGWPEADPLVVWCKSILGVSLIHCLTFSTVTGRLAVEPSFTHNDVVLCYIRGEGILGG
jgi:hypothetical protein